MRQLLTQNDSNAYRIGLDAGLSRCMRSIIDLIRFLSQSGKNPAHLALKTGI